MKNNRKNECLLNIQAAHTKASFYMLSRLFRIVSNLSLLSKNCNEAALWLFCFCGSSQPCISINHMLLRQKINVIQKRNQPKNKALLNFFKGDT